MPRISAEAAGGINRCAFLDMIAWSEISPELLAVSDDGYNVLVGSLPAAPNLFTSYAQHPDVLVTLPCGLQSTAAGRYQFIYRFWLPIKAQLGLPDFGPVSQDIAALEDIRERGALAPIDAGNFTGAVALCANIWSSLAGSKNGQRTNSMASLQAAFTAAGGVLAS